MATTQIEIRSASQRATIGTGQGCHARILNDPLVSPVHAHVMRVAAGWFTITDAGSANGTRIMRGLNEYRLTAGVPFRLVRGDTIVVGHTLLPWSGEFL